MPLFRASVRPVPVPVHKEAEPLPADADEPDEPLCRLCWAEKDAAWGGELLSPCRCAGTMQHIHLRCLVDWQRTLRSQGLARRAGHCELCKAPYALPRSAVTRTGAPRGPPLSRAVAAAARGLVADAARVRCWPSAAMRVWRVYVLASGALRALQAGATGFATGMSVGRALIEEQTSLLGGVLASMNNLLGSPYAELLWCQAVGALLVGVVSELVYCGVLGGLGGLAYGFATGYIAAIRGSARLVARAGAGALSATAWLAASALRRAACVRL